MSVWVHHGDKPQRSGAMVQHTGGEGRKLKTKKVTLHFQVTLNQCHIFLHNSHGLWLCCRWRGWTSRWWAAPNSSSAAWRRSLSWDAPGMLWRLNCRPSTEWYPASWPSPTRQGWQQPWHLHGAVFPKLCPSEVPLFAKGSMAKKRACGQVSLGNAGSTGTFLQAFNKPICPVDLPEGDAWYSAFQTYLTLDPLF